jgi:hypothetical protein
MQNRLPTWTPSRSKGFEKGDSAGGSSVSSNRMSTPVAARCCLSAFAVFSVATRV